jgi:long-chain fatty acid transport protein
MKSMKALGVAAAVWMALAPTTALAAGYSIYEQGAAVLGMAGAGAASVADPSAVFFNPAALTRLEGTQLLVGGTMLSPVTSFAGVAPYPGYGVTEEMKQQYFFPPTVYVSHRLAKDWAIGAGFNSPFGLGIEWKNPDAFTGRYIVTKADLQALNANLSAAYAPNDIWSAGVGADLTFAKVKLQNREQAVVPGGGGAVVDVAKVALESNYTTGWGWNAAVTFQPAPEYKLAASYHSKVIVDATGDALFTQILTGDATFDAAVAAGLPPNQGVSTVLRFPASWTGAVAYKPSPEWTVEADGNFFEWSVFEDLPIRFDQTPSANQTIVENYKDSWQFRIGAEHRMSTFTYRFGYYYDQAAAPDESLTPILPDANRNGATLGLGFKLGADRRWTVDLYEMALFVDTRSTNGVERDGYNGEYKSFVNAAGIGLGYRW